MSSGDHLTVMLPVKGGAPEVYQTNFSVLHFSHVFSLQQVTLIFCLYLEYQMFTSVLCMSKQNETKLRDTFFFIKNTYSSSRTVPYLSCVVRNFPVRGTEQNILRLQISVRQSEYKLSLILYLLEQVWTGSEFLRNLSKIVVEAILIFSIFTCIHVET